MHNSPQRRSVVSFTVNTTHGDRHTHTHTRHTCWINWSVINQLVLPLLARLRYSLYDTRNEYSMAKCSCRFNNASSMRKMMKVMMMARTLRTSETPHVNWLLLLCYVIWIRCGAAALLPCFALCRRVSLRCDAVVAAAAASSWPSSRR